MPTFGTICDAEAKNNARKFQLDCGKKKVGKMFGFLTRDLKDIQHLLSMKNIDRDIELIFVERDDEERKETLKALGRLGFKKKNITGINGLVEKVPVKKLNPSSRLDLAYFDFCGYMSKDRLRWLSCVQHARWFNNKCHVALTWNVDNRARRYKEPMILDGDVDFAYHFLDKYLKLFDRECKYDGVIERTGESIVASLAAFSNYEISNISVGDLYKNSVYGHIMAPIKFELTKYVPKKTAFGKMISRSITWF